MTTIQFDVFLSYSEADQQAAMAIADALRTGAGLHPFLDRWHLSASNAWDRINAYDQPSLS